MVDLARLLIRFSADNACGKTIPCRIGLRRLYEIGDRVASGRPKPTDPQLLEELARSLLDSAGVTEEKAFAASVALEEALSNVIRHGYDDQAAHEISICIGVENGSVVLEIVDEGKEFDPRSAPRTDVRTPLAERTVGGLGLHLLQNMVGDIRYERSDGRNRLRLCI